jgi:hypothetical protein
VKSQWGTDELPKDVQRLAMNITSLREALRLVRRRGPVHILPICLPTQRLFSTYSTRKETKLYLY